MPRPPNILEDHDDFLTKCLSRLNDAETALQDIRCLIKHTHGERGPIAAELKVDICHVLTEEPNVLCHTPSVSPGSPGGRCATTFSQHMRNFLGGSKTSTFNEADSIFITDEVVFKALTTDQYIFPIKRLAQSTTVISRDVDISEFKLLAVGRTAQAKIGRFWAWPPLINPESWFATLFVWFGILCILFEVIFVPLQFAFDYDLEDWMMVLYNISDAYFLMDIPFTFLLMYEDGNGDLVTSWRSIARRYVSTWFALDCAAAIPSQLLDLGGGVYLLRLRKLFRLIRTIPRLLKIHRRLDRLFVQMETMSTILRALQLALVFVMAVHWFSCGWYFVGTLIDDENPVTWLTYYGPVYGFKEQSLCYFWSAYFVVTTMTTIGYGDITPRSIHEVNFALFLLPIACVCFSVVMGTIMEFIASLNSASRLARQKRRRLSLFLQWRRVPPNLRHRVKTYMNFLWNTSNDNVAYEEEIKGILPMVLHEDLCYSLYKEVLEAAPFLNFMRHYTLCMRHLASLVRMKHFEVGDTIFRLGENNCTLYILLNGRIWLSLNQVLSTRDNLKDKVGALHFSIASLATKSSRRPESQRYHAWHSSYLTTANFKLEVHDVIQRRIVRKLQRRWRERKAAREAQQNVSTCTSPEKKTPQLLCSHMVSAPAYIGESCLWSDCRKWNTEPPPVYSYTASCTTRVELMVIERSMLLATMDRFSPWLEERFELFQGFVTDTFAAKVAFRRLPTTPAIGTK